MANYNYTTGGWIPAGKSAIWNSCGELSIADEVQNALVTAKFSKDGWTGKVIEFVISNQ